MTDNKTKNEQDRDLAKSLEQSFPASDPASTNEVDDQPIRPADRKTPVVDHGQVDEIAKQAERKSEKLQRS